MSKRERERCRHGPVGGWRVIVACLTAAAGVASPVRTAEPAAAAVVFADADAEAAAAVERIPPPVPEGWDGPA